METGLIPDSCRHFSSDIGSSPLSKQRTTALRKNSKIWSLFLKINWIIIIIQRILYYVSRSIGHSLHTAGTERQTRITNDVAISTVTDQVLSARLEYILIIISRSKGITALRKDSAVSNVGHTRESVQPCSDNVFPRVVEGEVRNNFPRPQERNWMVPTGVWLSNANRN